MTFRAAFLAQPKPLIYAEALVITLAIGWLDYITDWELSLFVFYAVPILMVVWLGDKRAGFVFAIVCAVVWHFANTDMQPYKTTIGYILAVLNRLAFFIFVAIGGTAMRVQREETRARLEAMTRARELEQEIVRVSEREQMRIGQDLHDGLCQNLVAIDCAAACLKADLDAQANPQAKAASLIQRMLKDAVVEARSLARGIFPVQVDAEGLAAALEELAATSNQLRQASVTVATHGNIHIADPQVAMHLYRIAREALSNALRHAQADHVTINLRRDGSRLVMTIADDGCGFAPDCPNKTGMGLQTMRYRAQLIGAGLEVLSESTGGSIVRCTVEMPRASTAA